MCVLSRFCFSFVHLLLMSVSFCVDSLYRCAVNFMCYLLAVVVVVVVPRRCSIVCCPLLFVKVLFLL